jgi:hypothetical protein
VLAAWLTWRRVAVLLSGGTAEGMVTEHERREIDESVGFHPVVTFVDHNGLRRHFTSSAGWSTPSPKVGAKVRVRYLRSDPDLAYIQSFLHIWAGPVALAAFVVAALVAAAKVWPHR